MLQEKKRISPNKSKKKKMGKTIFKHSNTDLRHRPVCSEIFTSILVYTGRDAAVKCLCCQCEKLTIPTRNVRCHSKLTSIYLFLYISKHKIWLIRLSIIYLCIFHIFFYLFSSHNNDCVNIRNQFNTSQYIFLSRPPFWKQFLCALLQVWK